MPDQERYHCPGFRSVPLLPGFCECRSLNPVPFAHSTDYVFNGDRPFHLRTHPAKSVFGKTVVPKDSTLCCARMKLFPVAIAYPIGDEIPVEPSR
jgi:hypothetical protein